MEPREEEIGLGKHIAILLKECSILVPEKLVQTRVAGQWNPTARL